MTHDQSSRDRYRATAERYVYVVEFSTGIVKVGQASDKTKRVAEHGRVAEKHGATVNRSWISGPHKEYSSNEIALIDFCSQNWALAGGREYFANADYERIVAFAAGLPMSRITEVDIDEFERRTAAREKDANLFVRRVEAVGEAMRSDAWTRAHAENAKAAADNRELLLLEDIAPNYESAEHVTAASMATHHAALAYINHHLRMTLDPYVDTRAWKEALATATHSYGVSLLLRELRAVAGDAVADALARRLWSDWNELAGDWGEQLASWVSADGVDSAVLLKMVQNSHEQAQKLKAMRLPTGQSFESEHLSGGAS